jgi:predicted DNA-binding mobile mystery protein A
MHSKSTPKPLARQALDVQLAPFRKAQESPRPPRGWIKAIRESLGMTTAQLAKRVGVSQPRVSAIEKAEAEDSVTLRTLRQAAEVLGCRLVYALVPDQPLERVVRERARRIAGDQLARTHHTMKLEDQAVEPRGLERERERLVDELLRGDPRRLWDAP